MNNQKVWLVTGASKGLGLSLVKQLLTQGYKVAATSRNIDELTQAVGDTSPNFLPLAVNLTSESSVEQAIAKTADTFGRLDVVVNNAGYGQIGALEELSDQEARANFDINVFGTLNIIRKALPYMRQQQQGYIINIASIAGFTGMFPGFGIYCATKFAVHGLTEALATEVKPLGLHATVVSPGYFRTSFLTSDSLRVPQTPVEAYKAAHESQDLHQNSINGNQANDPEKGAAAIITLAETENPPMHLYLGEDAFNLALQKLDFVKQELDNWKELSTSTGF